VHGDQRVQPRSRPPPDDEILVLEGFEVGDGQLLVIVRMAIAPVCRARLPTRTGLAPPAEPVDVAGTIVVAGVTVPVLGLVVPVVPLVDGDPVVVPVVPVVPVVAADAGGLDSDGVTAVAPVAGVDVADPGVAVEPGVLVVGAGIPAAGVDVVPLVEPGTVDGVEPVAGTLT
jgi:hypothetical protein